MPTPTIVILLTFEEGITEADAIEAADALLDQGIPQDLFNEIGPKVKNATSMPIGWLLVCAEHAHTALTFDTTDATTRKVAENLHDAIEPFRAAIEAS